MQAHFRNVNDAFYGLVAGFDTGWFQHNYKAYAGGAVGHDVALVKPVQRGSRNGGTLTIEEPVTITYEQPRERVLFNTARDANPVFHLFEALWMLTGRNDLEPLEWYNSKMKALSDDGYTLNGAYGYRWRMAEYDRGDNWSNDGDPLLCDQLDCIIDHLTRLPDSRRAVLQMWNVKDDLLRIGSDLGIMQGKLSKDVCCNLSVMFAIRETYYIAEPNNTTQDTGVRERYLDMTVTNRSNDLILGALGANVVHFSMLQEYMANSLGVGVGRYHQISNNLHVYLSNWKPTEWLDVREHGPAEYPRLGPPLVQDRRAFDREVVQLVGHYHGADLLYEPDLVFDEPLLNLVARPMCMAFANHKGRMYEEAYKWMGLVAAEDWHVAGVNWLNRRETNWKHKQQQPSKE